MKKLQSTKNYVFDTDCLSTFFAIEYEDILFKIFDKIIVPQKVYNEICEYKDKENKPKYKDRIDKLIRSKKIVKHNFEIPSDEALQFFDMINKTEMNNIKVIGQGEAACIAYAITKNGVICSNNLSDILFYVEKYHLEYLITADIFCILYENKVAELYELEQYWNIIKKRSKLPNDYFKEYYDEQKG